MRYFYLLFVIYFCECHDEWYQGYNDRATGARSYDYYRDLGSDGKDYLGNKQNKGYNEKRSDKGVSVDSGHKMDNYNDKKEYEVNPKIISESEEIYNNTGAKEKDSYESERENIKQNDGKESDEKSNFRNTKHKYDQINNRNDNRDYSVSFHDSGNKFDNDKRTDDRKYNQNSFIDKREYNNKCRYIGPLYDIRKLDKFEYRSDNKDSRSDWNRIEYDRSNGQYDDKCRYDGKNDEIMRPCALNDWECIRKFLAGNSECKPAYGPTPDPIFIPVDKFFIPVVNLTITHTDLRVRGFESTKITEFYLNKDTGNLVIAIDVLKVNQTSPKSFFTYRRTAKEPIVLADFTTVQYKKITFTAVLPYYPHLRLDKAEIHADVDGLPTYKVGPGIFNSKDPDVVSAFAQFKVNIPMVVQEANVFQSFLLTATYIQKSICDFGIDVYGNYLRFLRSKGFVVPPKLYDYNRKVL